MTTNLLELIQNQLSGSVMSNLGGLLGTNRAETQSAVAAAAPSLVGGLMKPGSTEDGVQALGNILDQFDDGIMDRVKSMFGGGNEEGMMDLGGHLLGGLFGSSLGSITDVLAKATGLGGARMGSLLKMLAPVAFGVLAKQKSHRGLGPNGLGQLLMGQAEFLEGRLPAGMGQALGINGLLGESAGATGPHQSAPGSKGSIFSKLVPVAFAIAVGVFAYNRWTSDHQLQASDRPAVGISAKLTETLGGLTSELEAVTDAASAQAALPQIEWAAASLDGIAASASALPAAARGPLRTVATQFLPTFETLAAEAAALGGVKDVLGSVLGTISGKLKALAG